MALTKTGAALKGYGNSYSETIGLITAGTEMLPNQASKVARGWRTIGANVLKLAQSQDTLSAANGRVNISLRDSQGNMKSTYAILKDLYNGVKGQSVAWKDLSQEEQSAISLMLAGKTQTEVFKSTMDNFSQAIKANETALHSQGSAAKENEAYLDSLEGHLNSFQSAWQKLSHDLLDSNTLKGFIDIGTGVVNVIDKIVNALDKLPGKTGTFVGLAGLFGGAVGAKKLWATAQGLFSISKGAEEVGEATQTATSFTSLFSKGLSSILPAGTSVIGALGVLAGVVATVGTAFYVANKQYKNSFRGKVDEYHKIGSEVSNIQSQIEALQSKEGELTSEEQTRLNILQMQLQILQKQQEIKQKEVTQAFNKEAKKNLSQDVSGLAKDSQTPAYGEKYIKAQRQRISLEKQIADLQRESAKSGKVNAKQLEELNKQYEEAVANESDWLDALIKQNDLLAELSYDELDKWGKSYYDGIHKAYLQAQTDIRSVQDAVGRAVDTFGSKQFDAWNIDVSSLKNAADLADQIKSKISELGDGEEITIYARDEAGNIIDEITHKKGELTDKEWELVIDATTTGNYKKLQEYVNSKPEHKEILMDFLAQGDKDVEAKKNELGKPVDTSVNVDDNGTANKTGKNVDSVAKKKRNATVNVNQKGVGTVQSLINGIRGKNATINVNQKGAGAVQSVINSIKGKSVTISIVRKITEIFRKRATGKRKGEQGGVSWLGDEGTAQNPKPELVVGEDGAYLAGTGGWELYDLKSTDTVYTAAQTKKLLNGRQKFTVASNGELPRFAKGTEEIAKDEAMRLVGLVGAGGMSVADAVRQINAISGLDAEEKKDYRAQAYQQVVSYNLKEFQNGRNTRQAILNDIKNYYNTRGKYDATYYEMIDELRKADQEKEVKRLEVLKSKEEDKFNYLHKYAQRQKDYYDKQIEQQEEEAEQLEKLTDLQDKLNDAKKTMVKVYKEGEGFVYEQDVKAVREATKELEKYNKEYNKSDLQKKADEWQAILDIFEELEELSEMKELEISLGINNVTQLTGGDIGTDIKKWTTLVTKILSARKGYEDLANVLNNATGTDIETLIGKTLTSGNKSVSNSLIEQYLAKHSFANGSLNTPTGFSFVGEDGPELRYLKRGSAIFPNDVSRNLMEWGQYSPAQVLSSKTGTSQNQTFNFDKIVLPNVRNADDFYKELKQLPNQAIQQSTFRI